MENAPRKKEKRIWKKRTALLLLLLAAVGAGAGVSLLRLTRPAPPAPERTEKAVLLGRSGGDIASIAVYPREGEAYSLTRAGEGFSLSQEPETALRESAVENMLLSLSQLPAENVVLEDLAATGLKPADFGLDPALARVAVTYSDGETRELLLGGQAPNDETPQRYCMLSGDGRLYTILLEDSAPLLREKAYLRQFDQPKIDASLLDRIEISGDIQWSLRYTPSGWLMDAPFSYPLSTLRTDALLSQLESIAFDLCLGDADKLNLSAYGLDEPALTVRLTQAATVIEGETASGESVALPMPEQAYTLLVGAETGRSGVYAQWEGRVFLASNFRLGFLKKLDPMDCLLQTPVNFLVNDLTGLTIRRNGRESGYEVRMVESVTPNNQIATDEYGRVLYDAAVRRAGEEQDMDAEAFLSWYTQLAALTGDGTLPEGFLLSGEPRCQVEIKNEHLTRTVSFYPYDALHDALSVDGVAVYYVQKTWLDSLPDAP